MIPSTLRRIGAACAAAVALALGGTVPAAAAPPPTLDYVNFGDSFSAGWGANAPSFEPNPEYAGTPIECYVSGPDHVTLLDQLKAVELDGDYACAGARLDTIVFEAQVAVQHGDLTAGTDLITLTAGGNDVGFEGILSQCLAVKQAGGTCIELFRSALTGLPALTQSVAGTTATLRALAPNARIAWAGYPHLITADPAAPLPGAGVLSLDEAAALNTAIDALNAAIAAGVSSVPNAQYVSVVEKFAGHELGTADPWVTPLVLDETDPRSLFNLHPTGTGYARGYYPAYVSAVKPAQLPRH